MKEDMETKINNIMLNSMDSIEHSKLFELMLDSIKIWKLNSLPSFQEEGGHNEYFLDSLYCINTDKTRLVTCLLGRVITKTNPTGGISFFYGEQIDNKWYFFTGDHIFIPTEMKNKNGIFTYKDLHEIALKEVYKGYLKPDGEINEDWFTNHFENIGWGDFNKQEYNDWCFKGKRYSNKKDFYIACHFCKILGNWASRDTSKPILSLPSKETNLP